MLDGLAALPHLLRVFIKPALDGLEDMLMLPPWDAAVTPRPARNVSQQYVAAPAKIRSGGSGFLSDQWVVVLAGSIESPSLDSQR